MVSDFKENKLFHRHKEPVHILTLKEDTLKQEFKGLEEKVNHFESEKLKMTEELECLRNNKGSLVYKGAMILLGTSIVTLICLISF
jgi:hypothetical protein